MSRYMILPASDPARLRLVSIPEDMEEHEAFRCATGVIAQAQEDDPNRNWDDISDALEEFGFNNVDFILGPDLGQWNPRDMADLFSVSAPLMIKPSGEAAKVVAEIFPHPEGLVYFDLYWHLGQPDETIHLVTGDVKGEGPWKVGDNVFNVLGCRGTDAGLAMAYENWVQYLASSENDYPPEPLRNAIARRNGAAV